ncbi:MAG: hypothetical protein N2595_06160 [bacterium]|nr:hypothetical protein [bacterium]
MKALACALAVLMAATTLMAGKSHQARPSGAKPINPAYGVARGFANIMTGWLEIPRGLIYENSRIPIVGFLSGPIKGAFLTTWRELAGVTDVVTFGLTGKGLYYHDLVPDFVWDARWIPPTKQTYVNPRQGCIPLAPKGRPCPYPCKGKKSWKKPCPPSCPPACPPPCGECK